MKYIVNVYADGLQSKATRMEKFDTKDEALEFLDKALFHQVNVIVTFKRSK